MRRVDMDRTEMWQVRYLGIDVVGDGEVNRTGREVWEVLI